MLRVLMILEDYSELMFLQTVLKKIGFDVEAIQNPALMEASILKLNPDLLLLTAYGKRIKGIELSKMVKRLKGLPHIVLIRPQGAEVDPDPNIEGWVESPVVFPVLLKTIAEVCGVDYAVLDEKFGKLRAKDIEDEKARILLQQPAHEPLMDKSTDSSGEFKKTDEPKFTIFKGMKPTTVTPEERKSRYDKFLNENAEASTLGVPEFTRKQVHDQVEKLRKAQVAGAEELEKERRAFVEQLFKKK